MQAKDEGGPAYALATSNVALSDLAKAVQMMLGVCAQNKVKFPPGAADEIAKALQVSAIATIRNSRAISAMSEAQGGPVN